MSNRPKRPSFSIAPVADVAHLTNLLGISQADLDALVASASQMYRHVPQKKRDGSKRDTWDAFPPLKQLQEKIKNRFLRRVAFPLYLQTGILDKEFPRDYAHNAAFHAGAKCVVTLDIENFFLSITAVQVLGIWADFFRFDKRVAETLTALTTKDGYVPQGAKTSSYLANLVFWKDEHELFSHLASLGWDYSRLADDVTISSKRLRRGGEVGDMTRTAVGFIQRHGFRVKRSKHKVFWRNTQMIVNNLVVNAHPALPKGERRRIRAQVDALAMATAAGESIDERLRNSTRGKIAKLRRFHPQTANRILRRPSSE